jgi:hypothetical protein
MIVMKRQTALTRRNQKLNKAQRLHRVGASRVVIEVSGGVVQAVLADGRIGVDLVDLDNARETSSETLAEARQFLNEAHGTLKCVF